MSIGVQINRALIAIHAYLSVHKKSKTQNKTVLIVFQQIFGDSVVIQNSLTEYIKLFPVSEGYKVKFLARPSVLSFMQSTLPLPDGMEFEAVDFKKFLEDYSYYWKIVKKYRGTAGMLIVPGTSLSAEIFSVSSDAKRKVGLVRSIDVIKPWIMAYFYRVAYTEAVRPDKEDMMLQRHRQLINYLWSTQGGKGEYKAGLPRLLKKERIIGGKYIVICPGSSKMEKCWPIERFAEVADYMIQKYGLPIHLCGGADEKKFADQLTEGMKNRDRVVSHIGTTSFSDWSAIVQHADLVVCNDSATMHLAASGRVPAVCIAGVYDKYQFFPYKVDIEEDSLPVTILKDMPCEHCRTIGYDAGIGNEECKKRIDAGLCSTCIDLITVEEVEKAIDAVLASA